MLFKGYIKWKIYKIIAHNSILMIHSMSGLRQKGVLQKLYGGSLEKHFVKWLRESTSKMTFSKKGSTYCNSAIPENMCLAIILHWVIYVRSSLALCWNVLQEEGRKCNWKQRLWEIQVWSIISRLDSCFL